MDINLENFILSVTKASKRNYKESSFYEMLKTFFLSITSIYMDTNVCFVLLDDRNRIIEISYNDMKDYNKLYYRLFDSYNYSFNEIYHEVKFENKDFLLFLSAIYTNKAEDASYRYLILSDEKETKTIENIYQRLHKSMTTLLAYHYKEFDEYNNLLDYLDAVDDGISACNSSGIVTYINKSGANILNTKKEEVMGKELDSLISDAMLSTVIRSKQTYQDVEYSIDFKNKNVRLMTSAYPVYSSSNKIIGAIDIFRKIKRSIKVATELAGYGARYTFDNFIGESEALSNAIELSKKFSHSIKNVLIIGESGTGKELFAQSIHNHSIRKNNPFIAINCASYPKDLFDSELFGYEEGAFTGAKKGGKVGKFELADGGTIFLDEIGEMPLHLQAKLLRVIETKSITRIGSNKNVEVDVRIISATNRDLESMVKNNSFREDLYYRLRVLFLHLEPLRNRGGDAVLLSNYFINKFSANLPKPIATIEDKGIDLIRAYSWPGNIRELENTMSLALFYCNRNYISKEDLINAGLKDIQADTMDDNEPITTLSKVTKDIILDTLKRNNGNKKKTAEELGISRSTIYRMLDDFQE